jgi:hypothetical protein
MAEASSANAKSDSAVLAEGARQDNIENRTLKMIVLNSQLDP